MAAKSQAEIIAEQTGTRPEDWARIPTNTKLYNRGYRWWNKVTGQHAKRVLLPEQSPTTTDTDVSLPLERDTGTD